MQRFITSSAAETEQLASRLAQTLQAGDIIAFVGGMGMGKTCFTHGLAAGLGIDPGEVSSPTFALVNEYRGGRLPLFHFDMYRLDGAEDLFDIGWDDYLDRGGVCAVEWSERVAEALPPETLWVTLSRCPGHENWRAVTVEGVDLT